MVVLQEKALDLAKQELQTKCNSSSDCSVPSADAAEKNAASVFYNKKTSRSLQVKQHLMASVVFIWFTVFNALVLVARWVRSLLVGTPLLRQPKKGRMAPQVLDFTTMSESEAIAKVRDFACSNEPVILRNIPERYFDYLCTEPDFNRPEDFPGQSSSGAYLIMDFYFFPFVGAELTRLIQAMLTHTPAFMARFQGGYKTCVAHIDSGSTFNFYYMRRGSKQVTLVPPEFSQELELVPGKDSVFVEGSSEMDFEKFGHQYSAHYYFTLEEGEVLVFNNCALLHQFTNLTGKEEIYTLRTPSFFSAHSATLYNDMLNYGNALHMAREALIPRAVREITFMH